MKKSELNQNIYLQEGNTVLKDNDEYGFLIFSLLARENCPYATDMCKRICYGRNAQELFKHVYNCRKRNFEESKKDTFVEDMIKSIEYNLTRKKYTNKTILFRIHETGDFYNEEYLNKWICISNYFRGDNIKFQAYTKSLPFITDKNISKINIKLMFSIMPDTKEEDILKAKQLGLNLFLALPSDDYIKVETENQCKGDCSNCKECYLGNKDMCVEFHGNRCPRHRGRIEYSKQIYWAWKYK